MSKVSQETRSRLRKTIQRGAERKRRGLKPSPELDELQRMARAEAATRIDSLHTAPLDRMLDRVYEKHCDQGTDDLDDYGFDDYAGWED